MSSWSGCKFCLHGQAIIRSRLTTPLEGTNSEQQREGNVESGRCHHGPVLHDRPRSSLRLTPSRLVSSTKSDDLRAEPARATRDPVVERADDDTWRQETPRDISGYGCRRGGKSCPRGLSRIRAGSTEVTAGEVVGSGSTAAARSERH